MALGNLGAQGVGCLPDIAADLGETVRVHLVRATHLARGSRIFLRAARALLVQLLLQCITLNTLGERPCAEAWIGMASRFALVGRITPP